MPIETRTVKFSGSGQDFEVLAGDTIIGPAIERGIWEEHETRLFRAHLAPGRRVVDLGANVGWFTVLAILAGCEVHAFEPVPHIADVLERNARAAESVGGGRATVHRAAAGSARGTARIALANGNFGDNRLLDGGSTRPGDMGQGREIDIAVERVDDHVVGPIDFLKVDTQGSEWHALQGARVVIDASPRLALLLEFWPYALRGASPEELIAFLSQRGFRLGKATAAPYPMEAERILRQARARDPVKGGLDLYGTRGVPFHVGGPIEHARSLWRSWRES